MINIGMVRDMIKETLAQTDPFEALCKDIDEIEPCPDQFAQEEQIEDDEISMSDAVETCHRIAERLRELER